MSQQLTFTAIHNESGNTYELAYFATTMAREMSEYFPWTDDSKPVGRETLNDAISGLKGEKRRYASLANHLRDALSIAKDTESAMREYAVQMKEYEDETASLDYIINTLEWLHEASKWNGDEWTLTYTNC